MPSDGITINRIDKRISWPFLTAVFLYISFLFINMPLPKWIQNMIIIICVATAFYFAMKEETKLRSTTAGKYI